MSLIKFNGTANLPRNPSSEALYLDTATNVLYQWDGDSYQTLYYNTDSNNNTVLRASDGRNIGVGPTRMIKASNSWLDDQPYGVTSPVRSMGKLVCHFKAAEWAGQGGNAGGTGLSDVSGYDAYGDKTGAYTAGIGVNPVSITGHPTLLQQVPTDAANEGIGAPVTFATAIKTTALNGKIGVWVYVEGPINSAVLNMELSTTSSSTNGLKVSFTSASMHPGWNFLVFVMRDYQAYVPSSGVTEYHPEGVQARTSTQGDGTAANIISNPIGYIKFYLDPASTAIKLYFDSAWTDFDTKAQYLMGFDSSVQNIIDYAIPYMRHKGYIAINMGALYYAGGSRLAINYDDFTSRIDTIYDAGWEVVNHTTNHLGQSASPPTMATLTDAAELAYEVKTLQAAMLSKGWTRGQHFYVAPGGTSSLLSQKVLADCGYKIQRHGSMTGMNQVTAYGIPNPRRMGGYGMGASGSQVTDSVTGGVRAQVTTGFYLINQAKAMVDMAISYGATWLPFSHGIETAGDDGTGNQSPSDPNFCKQSHFNLLMDYLHAKEDAGLITGLDGSDQLWYGASAQ